MSYYKSGIGYITVVTPKVGAEPAKEPTFRAAAWGFATLVGLGTLLWLVFRAKTSEEGPDTSDIAQRIRARGLDPEKFGI